MLGEQFTSVLRAALTGDESAFAALYRDAHPPLLRYLSTLSPQWAEDAASEAPSAVGDGGVGVVEFTVARHKVVDRVRYEARRPAISTDDLEPFTAPTDDIAGQVIADDDTQRALALVRTLPTDQAEAVLLHVMVGLGYAEIAQVMDRSSGAVRVLVHRGLRRLRSSIAVSAAGGMNLAMGPLPVSAPASSSNWI